MAQAHVDALNLIDIEFHGRGIKDREIVEAWKMYLDHLNDRNYPRDHWPARRVELFIVLLHRMAVRLGYDFDQSHLKNTSYFPEGYGMTMLEQQAIRKAALEILAGRASLPMHVVSVPGANANHSSDAQPQTVEASDPPAGGE